MISPGGLFSGKLNPDSVPDATQLTSSKEPSYITAISWHGQVWASFSKQNYIVKGYFQGWGNYKEKQGNEEHKN